MSGAARGPSYCHSGQSLFRKLSDLIPQQGRRAGKLQVAGAASGGKLQGPRTQTPGRFSLLAERDQLLNRRPADAAEPDNESSSWIQALSTPPGAAGAGGGPAVRNAAPGGARKAYRRRGQLRISGRELDDLAHQAAADEVVAIIGRSASSTARAV